MPLLSFEITFKQFTQYDTNHCGHTVINSDSYEEGLGFKIRIHIWTLACGFRRLPRHLKERIVIRVRNTTPFPFKSLQSVMNVIIPIFSPQLQKRP
jgi:hypothetical protein